MLNRPRPADHLSQRCRRRRYARCASSTRRRLPRRPLRDRVARAVVASTTASSARRRCSCSCCSFSFRRRRRRVGIGGEWRHAPSTIGPLPVASGDAHALAAHPSSSFRRRRRRRRWRRRGLRWGEWRRPHQAAGRARRESVAYYERERDDGRDKIERDKIEERHEQEEEGGRRSPRQYCEDNAFSSTRAFRVSTVVGGDAQLRSTRRW